MNSIVRLGLLAFAFWVLPAPQLQAVVLHQRDPAAMVLPGKNAPPGPESRSGQQAETLQTAPLPEPRPLFPAWRGRRGLIASPGGVLLAAASNPGDGGTRSLEPEQGVGVQEGNEEGADEENGEEEEEDDEEGFEDEFGDPSKQEVYDPFSGYNRAMTGFNDGFYVWVLDPVARGYRFITPEFARRGVANFFNNLLFPLRFINNGLQLKFKNAGIEFLRFCINTTIGILGFWDPAREWFGLEARPEDFGQTLGYWGVGAGPHIVLPFLGPSNLRDMVSLVPDFALDGAQFVTGLVPDIPLGGKNSIDTDFEKQVLLGTFREVNRTSLHIGEYENLKKDAIDLYPFLRDVYEQNRRKKIAE